MYGSEEADPIVRYYDVAFGINGKAEFPWIIKQIEKHPGRILDLGGGTGRFSLEALKRGNHVTYVDASSGMQAIFNKKLKEGNLDSTRLAIHEEKMHKFRIKKKFDLILCIDAFSHNLTCDDQRILLSNIETMIAVNGVL